MHLILQKLCNFQLPIDEKYACIYYYENLGLNDVIIIC